MFDITELQLELLRVLWERGEAPAAEVHEALRGQRDLAPTTVATLLTRLEKRGLVAHRAEGRRHVYRALVSESQVRTAALDTLTDELFGGDVPALLNHLLDARDIAPGDLARVKELLRRIEGAEEDSHER